MAFDLNILDLNSLRGLAAVLCITAFSGVVLWAYNSSKQQDFHDAAQLPFADEDININHNNHKKGDKGARHV